MLEALILQHLTTNASRQLNSQASRLLGTLPNISTSTASSSSTTGLSPPENLPLNDNESIISNASSSNNNGMVETNNFLHSFLKMQADLEKIHTLWPCSQNILLHPEQSALTSASLSSSSTSSNDASGRSIAVNGTSTRRDEEDLLSMVLRKGRMAYDYEPTKLDDIVIPNLPKEEGQDLFDDEDEEEEDAEGEAEMSRDNDPDNIDAEGESVEPSTTLSIPTSTGLNNSTSKRKSSNASKNSSGTSQGGRAPSPSPKSPEDLFKDEENYFRFSWPIIIHHRNSIAHTSSFGRALIFEMASRLGIDYIMPDILSKT